LSGAGSSEAFEKSRAAAASSHPRLSWPGGRRPEIVPEEARRFAVTERCGGSPSGSLFRGENLAVMQALLDRGLEGGIQTIYIDPPFASDTDYRHEARLEEHEARIERRAYDDRWRGGLAEYLQMLYPRLVLMRRLLSDEGSLYLHLDHHTVHYAKVLLDEIFGPSCFQREIIWRIGWISGFKSRAKNWIRNHDTILFYVRDPAQFYFRKTYLPHPEGYRRRDGLPAKAPGFPLEDVWNASPNDPLDSIQIKSFSGEKSGFNTQKNLALLHRILTASSRPGDLVADFFAGSGTTAVAAVTSRDPETGELAPRRWVTAELGDLGVALQRTRLLEAGATFEIEAQPGCEPASELAYEIVPTAERRDGARHRLVRFDLRSKEDLAVESWSLGVETGGVFEARASSWRTLGRKRRPPATTLEAIVSDGEAIAARVYDVHGRVHRVRPCP